MSLQAMPSLDDDAIFSLIKRLSGKRIEQQRRRHGITQAQLAAAVARSERWIRELEAGIPTASIEDHVRCAHWLGLSTMPIFIPFLYVEHGASIPMDVLALDDLWNVEQLMLDIVDQAQLGAKRRNASHSTRKLGANSSPQGR